jgi:hypothetical protein
MNANDFVTPSHILAEVLNSVDDKKLKRGFSKGWYISRMQDALQELAFDTFFDTVTLDYDFPQESLSMEIPQNVFNIREIHVYNGGCCSPSSSQVVHWKRLYNNNGGGTGYTSRIKDMGEKSDSDPFLPDHYNFNSAYYYLGTKYYANIQNGRLMFSSDCRNFNKVRIVVNGMGTAIGDAPIIPRFFERVLNDYIEERFYNSMKGREPRKYRGLHNDAYSRLHDIRTGSWRKAQMRISQMDTWQKESLEEYISSMYHK